MPQVGQEIRQLSSRFLDLAEPREASFPLYKIPLDFKVTIAGRGLLSVEVPGFPRFSCPLTVVPAEARKPFRSILAALLEESGVSAFRLGSLTFMNKSGLPDDGVFVRPSELKRIKNELFTFLDAEFLAKRSSVQTSETQLATDVVPPSLGLAELGMLARRDLISPPGMSPIPFIGGNPSDFSLSSFAEFAGYLWMPLPPVLLEETPWIDGVRKFADSYPETKLAVGLNNISQLALVSALSGKRNVWFFADFYLYAANNRTLTFLLSRIPRLLFAYEWLEEEHDRPVFAGVAPPIPAVKLSADFTPPLFYSFACFTRHSANEGWCVEGCPKDFSGAIRQGRNRFRILVRDCVTYVFS
jgi:hypothetical protein